MKYVALLRGINVGGHKKVPMEELKKLLEKTGFTNVKTLLASGNVLFDSVEKDGKDLTKILEEGIEKKFGFPVPVILREISNIENLAKQNPFRGIVVTPETRLYVTFFVSKPVSNLKAPANFEDGHFRILSVSDAEACSVLVVSPKHDTLKLMGILEKEYGKNVTTRNWNTVLKLLK